MKPIILVTIFSIHAIVFGRFYLARGRRLFNLLFLIGFALLVAYYGFEIWQPSASPAEQEYLGWVRWAGIFICIAATPFFIAHVTKGIKARALARNSLDREHNDN